MNTKWNATLLCTNVCAVEKFNPVNHNFVVGHKYKIKNGRLIDGNGKVSESEFINVETVNDSYYATFVEVNNE